MSLHDLQALEAKQETAVHLQNAQKNLSYRYDTRHVRSDGRLIDVEVNLKLTRSNSQYVMAFVRRKNNGNGNGNGNGTGDQSKYEIDETHRRFQAIIDNTSAIIYVKNLRGEYLLVNKSFERLFKMSNARIRGLTDHDIFPKQLANAFHENDKRVIKTGKPIEYDEVVNVDGKEQIYLSLKFPTFDNEGKVNAVCGISTNITKRKEIERSHQKLLADLKKEQITVKKLALEIEKNRRFLTDVLDGIPISIVYCDKELTYRLCNNEAAKVLNRKKKDVVGRSVKEIMNNDRQIIKAFKEVLATGKTIQMQPLVYRTPGTDQDRYYQATYLPHKDNDGNVVGVIAEGQDITDLMQVQKRLEDKKNRLEAILSSMNEGVVIVDCSGNIVNANPKVIEPLDRENIPTLEKMGEIIELSTLDGKILPIEKWPSMRALKGEEFTDWQIKRKIKVTGHETIVSVNGTYVKEDGKIVLGIITFRDITKQKKSSDLSHALNRINAILNSSKKYEKKFDQMLIEAAKALNVETAAIVLKEDDHWQIRHSYNFPEEFTNIQFSDAQARAHIIALQSGRTTVFNDASKDDRLDQKIIKERNFRSLIVTPFEAKDSFTGGISFHYHSTQHTFTDEEIDFAEKLGASITLTLQNMRLDKQNQLELSRIELLQEIAAATASSLKLEKIANKVLSATKKHLDIKVGSIYLVNEDTDTLKHLALFGYPEEMHDDLNNLPLDQGSNITRLISEKLPVLTHENINQPGISMERAKTSYLTNCRWIILPIKLKEGITGAFALAFEGLRSFPNDEIDLFKSITRLLGSAIENARLFEAEQQAHKQEQIRARRSETLNEFTRVRLGSTSLQDMTRHFAEKAAKSLGIEFIVILMANKQNTALIPVEWIGIPNEFFQTVESIPLNLNLQPCRVFQSNKPEFVENVDNYRISASGSEMINKAGVDLRSFATLPLQGKNKTLGVICFGWLNDQEFNKNDINFYQTMVSQLAMGMESILLLEESMKQSRTFQAINQMGSLISSTLNVQETLDQIADYSMLLLDASASAILVYDKESSKYCVKASEGISKKLASMRLSEKEVLRYHLNQPDQTKVFDLKELTRSDFFACCLEEKLVSVISAPINIENELFGLILTFDSKPIVLSEHERSAFNLFTNQVFTAINNAQRFEAESLVADTLQQALMTIPNKIDKITFGHVYNSATEMAKVGGDFYDIFQLGHDRIGIIIGDVSGKGLEAATITSLAKNTIRAYAYENHPPDVVMQKTNRILRNMLQESIFVTVFFGIIDTNKRVLTYCSCGHPQVILRKKNRSASFLKTDSPVLGVMTNAEFLRNTIDLSPGDLLFLYTDGVTEARADGSFFGEDKLMSLIKDKYSSRLSDELPELIFNDIRKFTKGVLADDIAMLSMGIL